MKSYMEPLKAELLWLMVAEIHACRVAPKGDTHVFPQNIGSSTEHRWKATGLIGAQRGHVTCLMSHSKLVADWGLAHDAASRCLQTQEDMTRSQLFRLTCLFHIRHPNHLSPLAELSLDQVHLHIILFPALSLAPHILLVNLSFWFHLLNQYYL